MRASSTRRRSGSTPTRRPSATRRRSRCSRRALLHGDQARRRALLPLLRRALRHRVHGPALRHPLRAARPPGRGDPAVRAAGARGHAADASPATARSRARFVYVEDLAAGVVARARPRAPPTAPTTSPPTEEVTIAEIAEAVHGRSAPSGSSACPAATATSRGAAGQRARGAASSAGAPTTPFREGLRRYVDWHVGQLPRRPPPARRSRAPVAARPARPCSARLGAGDRPLTSLGLAVARSGRADMDASGSRSRCCGRCRWCSPAASPRTRPAHAAARRRFGLCGGAALAVLPWPPWPGALGARATPSAALAAGRGAGDRGRGCRARRAAAPGRRAHVSEQAAAEAFTRFAIGFDERDRARLHAALGRHPRLAASGRRARSRAPSRRRGRAWNGLEAVAFSGWTGAALAALECAGVAGDVCCARRTRSWRPRSRAAPGRARRVRRLQPRGPLHVLRGLRAQGRAAPAESGDRSCTSAATSPSTSSASPSCAAPRASC